VSDGCANQVVADSIVGGKIQFCTVGNQGTLNTYTIDIENNMDHKSMQVVVPEEFKETNFVTATYAQLGKFPTSSPIIILGCGNGLIAIYEPINDPEEQFSVVY